MASIYTRRGDDGTTSLAGGDRVRKNDPRLELLGTLDEANCLIGLARVNVVESDLDRVLEFIQQRLFNCSACVAGAKATSEMPAVSTDDVASLEAAIDRYTARTGGFTGFTLPGGDETAARLHVARAVMRRAERIAAGVAADGGLDPASLAFLNRASDLLFASAALVGAGAETPWRANAQRP